MISVGGNGLFAVKAGDGDLEEKWRVMEEAHLIIQKGKEQVFGEFSVN